MFERRLRILLVIFAAAVLIIVMRLVQLQVVQHDHYAQQAEQTRLTRPESLPFVRGRIIDRFGEVLVCDAPAWDLRVNYSIIALEERHVARYTRHAIRTGRYETTDPAQARAAFLEEVEATWRDILEFAANAPGGSSLAYNELAELRAAIVDRVGRIRKRRVAFRGYDAAGSEDVVLEERLPHTILEGLAQDQQVAARLVFARYPWVHIVPTSRRSYGGQGEPFAHVLGRVGPVDAETIASDPYKTDDWRRYRGNEVLGRAGVERAAEARLRGRRGQITLDRRGNVVPGSLDAEAGSDVSVTLSGELQRRLYEMLAYELQWVDNASGGAVVVLDVPTREVLALVSYPSYDPATFNERFNEYLDDTRGQPLRFRAIASEYPPGSTAKPLACIAGLMNGVITLNTRETCTGYLFPDVRDAWRCWQVAGTSRRRAHGSINVVEAIRGSCNVFMYRLGERLGVDNECRAFDMFGIGRTSGIGLAEERTGINPWPWYLVENLGRPVNRGHARLFAIGQGELLTTPLQVANIMATYACGRFRPVTLMRGDEASPEWPLPTGEQHWRAIRQGMYEVVNHGDGTAFSTAHFEHQAYALCGKTGSATAFPWPTAYSATFTDSAGTPTSIVVPATSGLAAEKRFLRDHPELSSAEVQFEIASTWPPAPPADGGRYSHAWFGGFLQKLDTEGRPDWAVEPRITLAVLVEFGGSGGRVSGPIGREVARVILELFGEELSY